MQRNPGCQRDRENTDDQQRRSRKEERDGYTVEVICVSPIVRQVLDYSDPTLRTVAFLPPDRIVFGVSRPFLLSVIQRHQWFPRMADLATPRFKIQGLPAPAFRPHRDTLGVEFVRPGPAA